MYLGPRANSSASTVVGLLPEASGLQVTLDDGPTCVVLDPLSTEGATFISQQPSVVPKCLNQSFAVFQMVPGHLPPSHLSSWRFQLVSIAMGLHLP